MILTQEKKGNIQMQYIAQSIKSSNKLLPVGSLQVP